MVGRSSRRTVRMEIGELRLQLRVEVRERERGRDGRELNEAKQGLCQKAALPGIGCPRTKDERVRDSDSSSRDLT